MAELTLVPVGIRLLIVGGGARTVGDGHELCAIVGASSLQARTKGAKLHAAERLTVDHSTRDATVDIEVTSLDVVLPVALFLLVERLQTASQSIVESVDEVDCLL